MYTPPCDLGPDSLTRKPAGMRGRDTHDETFNSTPYLISGYPYLPYVRGFKYWWIQYTSLVKRSHFYRRVGKSDLHSEKGSRCQMKAKISWECNPWIQKLWYKALDDLYKWAPKPTNIGGSLCASWLSWMFHNTENSCCVNYSIPIEFLRIWKQ